MRYLSGVLIVIDLAVDGDADAPRPVRVSMVSSVAGTISNAPDRLARPASALARSIGRSRVRARGATIDEQLALIEPRPGAEPNAVDRVFVVADEDERRLPGPLAAVDVDAYRDAAIPPEDAERRDRHRRPLAVPLAPQPFPLLDDARIEADGGVVDEDAIVDLADVDSCEVSRRDDRDRLAKVERDVEILREVIEGAERENAERGLRADHAGRDAADGAVAAAGHDDGCARAGLPGGRRRVLAGAERDDLGVTPGGAKEIAQLACGGAGCPRGGSRGRRLTDDGRISTLEL